MFGVMRALGSLFGRSGKSKVVAQATPRVNSPAVAPTSLIGRLAHSFGRIGLGSSASPALRPSSGSSGGGGGSTRHHQLHPNGYHKASSRRKASRKAKHRRERRRRGLL